MRPVRPAPDREVAGLRARLADAEGALRAIRTGEVDAVVVAGRGGPRVFTLEGAGSAYRVLIESMNEGALTLAADGVVLYANRCFARMVSEPLEKVIGSSFHRLLSAADQASLRRLLKRRARSGSKLHARLRAADGSSMPAQISIRPLPREGSGSATIGIVVTDMTEARRKEEMLQALTHRVVQVQEAERGRVALELHDRITQPLCAVLFRTQALAKSLSARDGPAKKEAMKLRRLIGLAATEVERISRDLRPGVLDQLGLVAVLRSTGAEFADRTGVAVESACGDPAARLPADTELALYRILQESLKNVERHARARHVAVELGPSGPFVQMTVTDDGIGFDPEHSSPRRKGSDGLGLLGMGERAAYVGGALDVRSSPGKGTTIRARVPFPDAVPGKQRA